MTKTSKTRTAPIPIDLASVDWSGVTAALFSDLTTRLLVGLRNYVEAHGVAARAKDCDADDEDNEALEEEDYDTAAHEAAALLDVSVDATPDEVRAALRRKLATSRLHPDHGGSGEAATRLIAAKNLLIERAREVAP